MTALPVACSHDVTEQFFGDDSGQSSTGTEPRDETTTSGSSGSGGLEDDGSTSVGITATGGGTDETSTSDTATGDPSTGDLESSSDSTGGESDGGSSTTAAPTLCEAWGEVIGGCNGYGAAYYELYCENYLASPVCTAELLDKFECEAYGGGFCGAGCGDVNEALAACQLQAQAEALGCDDLAPPDPSGMLEAACSTTAQKAFACDQAGSYVTGFSQYTDDPEAMVSFCTTGAYWTFGVDPLSACGGAYEDLLACLQPLSCEEFDELILGLPEEGACGDALTAVECACNLGVG